MRTTPTVRGAAKRLRREMSRPEMLLWMRLRPCTPRVRRQHPLGPYVLDFYIPAARLVVEVDGSSHGRDAAPQRDEARDRWLAARGLSIRRLPAAEVIADPDGLAAGLMAEAQALAAAKRDQVPPPFTGEGDQPQAGGGGVRRRR